MSNAPHAAAIRVLLVEDAHDNVELVTLEQKPFSAEALMAKVHERLEQP